MEQQHFLHNQNLDYFLHVIQVGDTSLQSLPETNLIERENELGVEFSYNGKMYRIAFELDSTKDYGCDIQIIK